MRDIYNDDVHSVVTPGKQEEDDPRDAGEERQPVDRVEPLRCVWWERDELISKQVESLVKPFNTYIAC